MTGEDRDFLRFLWIKDIDQNDFELFVERFTSVKFGLTYSLLLLSMTVRHHLLKYLDLSEDLVMKFLNELYMDDFISGSDSSEKCFEFYLRMRTILNCAEIMEKINSFEEQEFGKKIVPLDKFHEVLDILWKFEIDELFFDLKNVVSESQISTKREFFKVLSSVYEPLGIVSRTIITLKMLFRKICRMKINWDYVLPETIIAEWQNILENVNVMNSSKLERHFLKMFDLKDVDIIELHGFSDGSLKAYAAVIYIKIERWFILR